MSELPSVEMWTEDSMVEWGKRCSKCERWRLRTRYYELHGGGSWWRECLPCTVETLGDALMDAWDILRPLAKIANEEDCPVCQGAVGEHRNAECPFVAVGLDALLRGEP